MRPTRCPTAARELSRLALPFALALATALAISAPAEATKRRAFVTSTVGTGDLSTWAGSNNQDGLAGANAVCQARATAGGLPNAAQYRAWLSTSTTDAYCNARGQTGTKAQGCSGGAAQPAGPWYQRDGVTPFTASLDALTGSDRVIYSAVIFDEFGNAVPDLAASTIWTGTRDSGTAISTCSDWTTSAAGTLGTFGRALGSAQIWTYWSSGACNGAYRLLCLEAGESEEPPSAWPGPSSLVFLTSAAGSGELGSWPRAGGQIGVEAGDAICRSLAADAGLPAPDSFVAWLSTAQDDALDRITSNGPFRRVDGVAVAASKAALASGALASSIHVDEVGRYLVGNGGGSAWTGTLAGGGLAAGLSCGDWVGGGNGRKGIASVARVGNWSDSSSDSCAGAGRLYCFSNQTTLFWDNFELTGDSRRWSASHP